MHSIALTDVRLGSVVPDLEFGCWLEVTFIFGVLSVSVILLVILSILFFFLFFLPGLIFLDIAELNAMDVESPGNLDDL